MSKLTKQEIEERIEIRQDRLTLYLEKEKDILAGGVQSYGIGNRSLARYNADLASVRKAISELEKEIDELTNLLLGGHPRRAVRIIPQDW